MREFYRACALNQSFQCCILLPKYFLNQCTSNTVIYRTNANAVILFRQAFNSLQFPPCRTALMNGILLKLPQKQICCCYFNDTQNARYLGQAYSDSSVRRCQLPIVKLSKILEVLVNSLAASMGMANQ